MKIDLLSNNKTSKAVPLLDGAGISYPWSHGSMVLGLHCNRLGFLVEKERKWKINEDPI
jgi:hypothetical protein